MGLIFFFRREIGILLLYLLLENTTFIVEYLQGISRIEQNPNFYNLCTHIWDVAKSEQRKIQLQSVANTRAHGSS